MLWEVQQPISWSELGQQFLLCLHGDLLRIGLLMPRIESVCGSHVRWVLEICMQQVLKPRFGTMPMRGMLPRNA